MSTPELCRLAFNDCDNITDVYCLSETPPSASNDAYNHTIFSSTVYENATLHVPSGCSDTYQAHSLWKLFNTIVDNASTDISVIEPNESVSISSSEGKIEVTGAEGIVSVFGMDGSIAARGVLDGNVEIVVPGGLYIVKVSDGKNVTIKKIIVK